MKKSCFVLRANSSGAIGTGHCMRLLALAEGIRDRDGEAIFLLGGDPEVMAALLRRKGFHVNVFVGPIGSEEDAFVLRTLAVREQASTVVVDGYDFTPQYFARLGRDFVIVAIDDLADQHWSVDIVVNPNYGAEELAYSAAPSTQLLCGVSFALLRSEFRRWPPQEPSHVTVRSERCPRLVVTFGGTDPSNGSARVLAALAGHESLEICVVVGAGFRGGEILQRGVHRALSHGHSVVTVCDPGDMSRWLAWSDMAITACGGTLWELFYLGVGVTAFSVVDNQDSIASSLRERNMIYGGQRMDRLSDDEVHGAIAEMIQDSRESRDRQRLQNSQLIDGRGVERILDVVVSCRVP